MAALGILQPDSRTAARLSAALGNAHRVVMCKSWEQLQTALVGDRFDCCLIDVEYPNYATAFREIGELRRRYPAMAIAACIDTSSNLASYELGVIGVAGVVACQKATAAGLRAEIDRVLSISGAEWIQRSLADRFPSPGPEAVGWAVEHAGSQPSVGNLAGALGRTPGGLRRALRAMGLPSPMRILLSGRLLLAAARLGRDGRTVEDVAYSLGYSSASSLARALKRHTGFTSGQLSGEDGVRRVLDSLFGAPPSGGHGPLLRRGLLALAAVLLAGCASLGAGGRAIDRDAVDALLESPPLSRAHVGVLAVDARTGRTLYRRNDDRWFVPASNQKILVTAAAWALLGPEYRYRTELLAGGPVVGGRVEGDLVLVGTGDPSLSARYWDSGVGALEALADSLRSAGVREVGGRLVVDVSAWDSTTVAPTREVDDLVFGYGATGGAFAIDEGELRVIARGAASAGTPATVEWSPRGGDGFVVARVETVATDSSTRIAARYLPESRRLVLEGTVAAGAVDTISFAQRDPVRQATIELAAALGRSGVRVEGGSEIRWGEAVETGRPEPAEASPSPADRARCTPGPGAACGPPRSVTIDSRSLARIESPRLEELVAGVLGPSQNWMAEQLVRTLGAELGGAGSLARGLEVVEGFLGDEVGIDTLDVRPRDGSGLSAYNLVTPRAVVRVLQYMGAHPHGGAWRRAMAEPSEEESTLEDRLAELEGRLFAKTGSISNVNTLSGYLVRSDGEEVIFSILSNAAGVSADEVRAAIDDIVRALAR